MRVKELIEELKKYDGDKIVLIDWQLGEPIIDEDDDFVILS